MPFKKGEIPKGAKIFKKGQYYRLYPVLQNLIANAAHIFGPMQMQTKF